jgi:hypothetical protein
MRIIISRASIRSAVKVLHGAGLVFGDLRLTTIVIDTTGGREGALLTDFDWVGLHGQAQYPPLQILDDFGEISWKHLRSRGRSMI